ncbi:MAG: hypothetical protein C5B56_13525 [Proteobacteria bacterium]|nr:MAG: hypothetical protein C5B56_13525 [Pseudomonadota bacterium]
MTIDPWVLAADCHRMMQEATDRDRKTLARHLRDFWLALGNEEAMMEDAEFEADVAVVKSMHDDMIAGNDW